MFQVHSRKTRFRWIVSGPSFAKQCLTKSCGLFTTDRPICSGAGLRLYRAFASLFNSSCSFQSWIHANQCRPSSGLNIILLPQWLYALKRHRIRIRAGWISQRDHVNPALRRRLPFSARLIFDRCSTHIQERFFERDSRWLDCGYEEKYHPGTIRSSSAVGWNNSWAGSLRGCYWINLRK